MSIIHENKGQIYFLILFTLNPSDETLGYSKLTLRVLQHWWSYTYSCSALTPDEFKNIYITEIQTDCQVFIDKCLRKEKVIYISKINSCPLNPKSGYLKLIFRRRHKCLVNSRHVLSRYDKCRKEKTEIYFSIGKSRKIWIIEKMFS